MRLMHINEMVIRPSPWTGHHSAWSWHWKHWLKLLWILTSSYQMWYPDKFTYFLRMRNYQKLWPFWTELPKNVVVGIFHSEKLDTVAEIVLVYIMLQCCHGNCDDTSQTGRKLIQRQICLASGGNPRERSGLSQVRFNSRNWLHCHRSDSIQGTD